MSDSAHPQVDKSIDWKWLATTVVALAVLGVLLWTMREDSQRAAAASDAADRRLSRIETAVHVLAIGQGERTRQLVDEALTVSQNPATSAAELIAGIKDDLAQGDDFKAISSAQGATSLLASAKELKTPVPPGYFATTLGALNSLSATADPNIGSELFGTRVALAEYESALEVAPDFPAKLMMLPIRPNTPIESSQVATTAVYRPTATAMLAPNASVLAQGAVIRGADLPEGADFLRPTGSSFAANGNSVEGLDFDGVTQTLDGIAWKNVVFVNAHIRYHGGDLKLDHVRFVHCTFDLPQSARGMQLANYAALGSNQLNIG